MKSFILGFTPTDLNKPHNEEIEVLREFKDKAEADYESEEWCEVFADTLEEAKNKYEASFLEWQKSQEEKYNKLKTL